MKTEESDDVDLVAVARLIKPKGLKGEMVAEVLTDFPERFENLETVILVPDSVRTLKIERFYFQNERVVFKFESVDSMERAEELRGLEVCVEETEVVELEEGEYFDWELEGCGVETADGRLIGTVKELFRAGENINLVVTDNGKEFMIPFVKAICPDVDIEAGKIIVDLPDGLLEF